MKIGFDAKRAFHNNTGLGNYSRTLIQGLSTFYPQHQYFLFNPKPSTIYTPSESSVHEVRPAGIIGRRLPSVWRSSWMKSDLKRSGIDLYHGLSNEIPVGLQKTGIPSIVTIHDLIFERFPDQFARIDAGIYSRKYRYACQYADHIIAISEQTKKDLIDIYGVADMRISVCYQSCDPAFAVRRTEEEKRSVRQRFRLPEKFFLSVGSIIERKNLLSVVKAFVSLRDEMRIPLVVIGRGGGYLNEVKQYLILNGAEDQVIFLNEILGDEFSMSIEALATIYQMAEAMIYASHFEGFGIPIIEALWSGLPVITSNCSSLPEAAGPDAFYADPDDAADIARRIFEVHTDHNARRRSIESGREYVKQFALEPCTRKLMNVYEKILANG